METCRICLEEILDHSLLCECLHSKQICKNCFTDSIITREHLKEKLTFDGLPCRYCDKTIQIDVLLTQVDDKQTKEILNYFATQLFLNDSACHQKCANRECQTSYLVDINCKRDWVCDLCSIRCPICNVTDHIEENCPSKTKNFGKLLSRAKLTYDSLTHKCMTCNGCGSIIYKVLGCNHITCANCKEEFCWVCGKTWNLDHTCTETWRDIAKGTMLGILIGMSVSAAIIMVTSIVKNRT